MSRRKSPTRRPRFILNLLGGGYLGLLQLLVLQEIEKQLRAHYKEPGLMIQELFDLVSGVSAGAINGAALLARRKGGLVGYSVDETIEIFLNLGTDIFPSGVKHFLDRFFRRGLFSAEFSAPLYDIRKVQEHLKVALDNDGQDLRLGEFGPAKLMIIGVDLRTERPRHFKSWRPGDRDLIGHQVVSGSSSAEAFFGPTGLDDPIAGWTQISDGGTSGNDPTVDALAECQKLWPDEGVISVTIGTGEKMVMRSKKELEAFEEYGAINLVQEGIIPGSFISRTEARSKHVARTFLGPDNQFHLNPQYVRSTGKMWDAGKEATEAIYADAGNYLSRDETQRSIRQLVKAFEPAIQAWRRRSRRAVA